MCGLGSICNSEEKTKVEAQVGTWFLKRLSIKDKAEFYAAYIIPMILFQLTVLPLPEGLRLVLIQSFFSLFQNRGKTKGLKTGLLSASLQLRHRLSDMQSH